MYMKQKHRQSLSRKDKEKRRIKAAKMFARGMSQTEVARKFKITISTTHLWHIIRGLGFTPQKPQVKSKQRNEKAIAQWITETLPRLKKMS